ncbi:F420-dependent NADP oxidoreductase [Acinetobacter sp. MD2(2019)]|uniref:Rossmann-like and DUF2520 domain-containing protein n=1 Tax=Acinetobacter sp. MD2(2019) TaxID=2605273 RepID=UPI002D1F01A0|nr:F420-dependent NADP oxidoreductase [Acinetobacter sp. MD2(2019)]MEB3753789.1 DUF2520 domain-containing protein [Acinetobacter sp. MD2(2019)]
MKISFIGSGRVATHFAKQLKQIGHHIHQIYSPKNAEKLAKEVCACAVTQLELLDSAVDIVIIAVSDQAIESVAQALPKSFQEVCIVHTSGSTDLSVLSKYQQKSGVLYPLQTFSFEKDVNWAELPILIEGNTIQAFELIEQLANSLSKKVFHYSSKQRLSLHLAAVFACNFSNYCYDLAHQLTDTAAIDFGLLHPLILETALKATQFAPHAVQTGPAKRHDQNILNMHRALLAEQGHESALAVYDLLSQQIQKQHPKPE